MQKLFSLFMFFGRFKDLYVIITHYIIDRHFYALYMRAFDNDFFRLFFSEMRSKARLCALPAYAWGREDEGIKKIDRFAVAVAVHCKADAALHKGILTRKILWKKSYLELINIL